MTNQKFEDICTEVFKPISKSYIPMSPEIVQTSSFYYETYEEFMALSVDEKNNYVYTRGSNPTTKILEEMLVKLESGEKCKVFSSGMGAISAAILTLVSQGDHILMLNTVYGETLSFVQYLQKFGIEVTNVYISSADEMKDYLQDNTKLVYFESPSTQRFELLDLAEVTKISKSIGAYTMIDATWASPIFQQPLKYGIDVVMHSLSKYIGGHSDIVGGAIIGKEEIVDKIFECGHQYLGAVNSPINSWLAIRGLRTLPVRMNQLDNSIRQVLDALKDDPRIRKIYHPYVGNDYQKELADKYLSGYGSLFSMELADEDFEKVKRFVNALNYFSIGVSWGGFESLVLPSFKGNNIEKLNYRGLKKSHIRMYVGLENSETLIEDLKQALDKVYGNF
ncbi:aminotransferase class I/II-fold pyridoxal phosphate-dependent enzyme [Caldifermentibacillus hisashii]|uniref:aminotransferase class I/II-fold pyridoxal phosphate-dependent enzyme n=1 Tax=Caldifermentibacillus hisashii TaxID=996558 RepID=UPI0031B7BBBE